MDIGVWVSPEPQGKGGGGWPRGEGVRPLAAQTWGVYMALIAHARALGRALFADQVGSSSIRNTLVIGLASSALLVLMRVAAAAATAGFAH
jgi:hypothetical protein